jgi:hypothetical protein
MNASSFSDSAVGLELMLIGQRFGGRLNVTLPVDVNRHIIAIPCRVFALDRNDRPVFEFVSKYAAIA